MKYKTTEVVNKKVAVYTGLYVFLIAIIASTVLLVPEEDNSLPLLRTIIVICATVLLTKYFIYMFFSPWHDVVLKSKAKRHAALRATPYFPLVSILVPAWNEGNGLITTVESLLKTTYRNLEILIVDNASTDSTKKNVTRLIRTQNRLIKRGQASPNIQVRYFYEGTQGKGHALNRGLSEAKGEIIMSIDADCYVPPTTVSNFVKHFNDPRVMAAVGNVRIGNTETILGVVQYLEFLFSFYFKKAEALGNTIYIIGGAGGAFRRTIFDEIGPYSTTNITEDIELSVRIQDAGMKIAYASDALIYTEGAVTLNGLMKQRLRWKRGRFETFFEHRDMFFSFKRRHNKLLTWGILPHALFGDLQLSFEMLFLLFLYVYSVMTNDFSSFISGIVVVSSMFLIQVFFDDHRDKLWSFILLAPIGWLLLYVSTYVETNALFKSVNGYLRKSEVTWQKWNRQGVFTTPTSA